MKSANATNIFQRVIWSFGILLPLADVLRAGNAIPDSKNPLQIWYFHIVLISIILILFWIIRFIEIRRLRLKNELEQERFENEKLTDIDHLKSRFFENLSHEFRTMLTLVTGPLESLQKSINEQVFKQNIPLRTWEVAKLQMEQEKNRRNLQIMQNNANVLSRLINQLLDLTQLEAGQLALRTRPVEIISVLRNLVLSFSPYAENKKIDLFFECEHEVLFAFVDLDKFEVIVNNLLSNATKFTPEGGDVSVVAKRINSHLPFGEKRLDCFEIQVSDTGPGISPEHLDKLFDRFYRAEKNGITTPSGSGIGLALTKDLVEAHYGKITVASVQKQGSTFTICLPIGKSHLQESEIAAEYMQISPVVEKTGEIAKVEKVNRNPEKPMVLFVEDNVEMRFYLYNILQVDFQVEQAENGAQAFEFVLRNNPDVILSDIMMPEMDGIELCRRIKKNKRLNHIPIILLTARAAETDRIKGLNIGADDYITKPFQNAELKSRITNILVNRQKFRRRIQKELLMKPEWKDDLSEDERLINKAKEIVQEHLADFDFTIEEFARRMALSRSYLNRKLQAIMGMSASRFIREIRLSAAEHLIEAKKGNVTEIALDVGFDNFAYFTRCFKEKFGHPPSKHGATV